METKSLTDEDKPRYSYTQESLQTDEDRNSFVDFTSDFVDQSNILYASFVDFTSDYVDESNGLYTSFVSTEDVTNFTSEGVSASLLANNISADTLSIINCKVEDGTASLSDNNISGKDSADSHTYLAEIDDGTQIKKFEIEPGKKRGGRHLKLLRRFFNCFTACFSGNKKKK